MADSSPYRVVNGPEGPINFPAQMSDEEVRGAMQKLYPPKQQAPEASISAHQPSQWELFKSAVPSVGHVSDILSGRKPFMAPMQPQDSGQLAYPERVYTPGEQAAHPIRTGVDEFMGGLTSPDNLLLMKGLGALGMAPKVIGKILPRLASGVFGAQMAKGGYDQGTQAVKTWEQYKATGDEQYKQEAMRLGTHAILNSVMALASGAHAFHGEPATTDAPLANTGKLESEAKAEQAQVAQTPAPTPEAPVAPKISSPKMGSPSKPQLSYEELKARLAKLEGPKAPPPPPTPSAPAPPSPGEPLTGKAAEDFIRKGPLANASPLEAKPLEGDALRAWQESIGKPLPPQEDIGSKVRSTMPSVPRKPAPDLSIKDPLTSDRVAKIKQVLDDAYQHKEKPADLGRAASIEEQIARRIGSLRSEGRSEPEQVFTLMKEFPDQANEIAKSYQATPDTGVGREAAPPEATKPRPAPIQATEAKPGRGEPVRPTKGPEVEDRSHPLYQLVDDFRKGIVYHGTTKEIGEKIKSEGLEGLSYGKLVKRVADKMGFDIRNLTADQKEELGSSARTYNNQIQTASVTHSPEIAQRWAGKGGEIAARVAAILGKKESMEDYNFTKGEPEVLKGQLNEKGLQNPNYLRHLKSINRIEAEVKAGKMPIDEANVLLRHEYRDIRIKPDEVSFGGRPHSMRGDLGERKPETQTPSTPQPPAAKPPRDFAKEMEVFKSRVEKYQQDNPGVPKSHAQQVVAEQMRKERGTFGGSPEEDRRIRRERKINEWLGQLRDPEADPKTLDLAYKMLRSYGLEHEEILKRVGIESPRVERGQQPADKVADLKRSIFLSAQRAEIVRRLEAKGYGLDDRSHGGGSRWDIQKPGSEEWINDAKLDHFHDSESKQLFAQLTSISEELNSLQAKSEADQSLEERIGDPKEFSKSGKPWWEDAERRAFSGDRMQSWLDGLAHAGGNAGELDFDRLRRALEMRDWEQDRNEEGSAGFGTRVIFKHPDGSELHVNVRFDGKVYKLDKGPWQVDFVPKAEGQPGLLKDMIDKTEHLRPSGALADNSAVFKDALDKGLYAGPEGQASIGGVKDPGLEELDKIMRLNDPREMIRRIDKVMDADRKKREGGFATPAMLNPVARLADVLDKVADFLERRGLTEDEFENKKKAENIIRVEEAKRARSRLVLEAKLEEAIKRHDNPTNERQNFIDFMNAGEGVPGAQFLQPEDQAISTELHKLFQEKWKKIADIKGFEGDGIESYLAHIWEKPGKAGKMLAGLLTGRRPLAGSGRFLRERFYQYASEGIDNGLTPVTWNPIRLQLAALFDVDRFIMAHEIKDQLLDAGLANWVKLREYKNVLPGHLQLDDRIFRPRAMGEGALKEFGTYYAPAEVAKTFNKHLAPGLANNPVYRSFRNYGNTLNMINLGFSGYHATMISLVSATSDLALGMQKVTRGDFVAGAGDMLRGTLGTFILRSAAKDYMLGKAIQDEAIHPTGDMRLNTFVNLMMRGGGRFAQDPFYSNSMADRAGFVNWLRLAKEGKIREMITTGVRKTSGPIMDKFVPRVKLGIAARMMESKLDDMILKQGITDRESITNEMSKIWDSVDNRAGQMVYDNLFWHRVTKDLSFLAVRAVGWDLGSFREYGGGALVDTPRQTAKLLRGERPELTNRMAFTIATPITIGLFGAMMHYFMTGKPPQKMEDYFFPGPDGEKISFPSYMKDYFAFKQHPLKTAVNKLHPTWGQLSDVYSNSDFYGTEIYHPGDPLMKQGWEVAKWYGTSFAPLGIRGAQKRIERGEPISSAATGFFGFMPASPYVTMSKAGELANDLSSREWKKGPRTAGDAERHALVAKFKHQLSSGQKLDMKELTQAWKDKRIQDTDIDKIYSSYNKPKLIQDFEGLPLPDALAVMRVADPNERVQLKNLLIQKYNQLDRYPLDAQKAYDREIREFVK